MYKGFWVHIWSIGDDDDDDGGRGDDDDYFNPVIYKKNLKHLWNFNSKKNREIKIFPAKLIWMNF